MSRNLASIAEDVIGKNNLNFKIKNLKIVVLMDSIIIANGLTTA
jgi:hypothetical protein